MMFMPLMQTIISGMGELHLDIYVERIRREYKVSAFFGRQYYFFSFIAMLIVNVLRSCNFYSSATLS